MTQQAISGGVVHGLPDDLQKALLANKSVLEKWENLTPLARNEWICWNTFVKQTKTRKNHIQRTVAELLEGKRRPCCWIGCTHRTDKRISPSVQAILNRRTKLK